MLTVIGFLFYLANFCNEAAFTERQLSLFQGFIARHSFLDQEPTEMKNNMLISIGGLVHVVNTCNWSIPSS